MIPKSILLYGPQGSGKTMLVQAVASSTGALFLNLSPNNLEGRFDGRTGPTKCMHMVFCVARNVAMAPVIIYIDEVDKLFVKSKKGQENAGRFKKDLITYKKWLEREHQVIIMGNCRE